ncbi:hypothetical protein F4814DRAFT_458428 [Daldinia grandis]|nr:hypothetical protein F4814DRAFT_458428 [Daldinia grandis]
MTGGRDSPRGSRRPSRFKDRSHRRRPVPPMPEWMETARKRRATEEAFTKSAPVKHTTGPVLPEPEPAPAPAPAPAPVPMPVPAPVPAPDSEPRVVNPPVTPPQTLPGQNQGTDIPEDVPINPPEEQPQQAADDSQLPPLADFLFRFGTGFSMIRNSVERGICGVQAIVHSLGCQDILPAMVQAPTVNDLLEIYHQNVVNGTYDISFSVTPEDRNMPGPFQAEIISHVLSEWSRRHSNPALLPHEESEESRLQRRVPPLVAGFHSEGQMPFAMEITEPDTRIVWIHNSGSHWEGIKPDFTPVGIGEIFKKYGHELFRSETTPQWFIDIAQRRQQPVQLLPRFQPTAEELRSADELLGLFGASPPPPPARTMPDIAGAALELFYLSRRRAEGDHFRRRHQRR